ncbi:MAG: hypothetical protein ACYTEX_11170 [Planctomycetota bacterium]
MSETTVSRQRYRYVWGNTPERAACKGRLCWVIARGSRQSIPVEFDDGHRMITSMRAVRRCNG